MKVRFRGPSFVLGSNHANGVKKDDHVFSRADVVFEEKLTPETVSGVIGRQKFILLCKTGGMASHGAVYFLAATKNRQLDGICATNFSHEYWAAIVERMRCVSWEDGNLIFQDELGRSIGDYIGVQEQSLVESQHSFSELEAKGVCYLPRRRMGAGEYQIRHPSCEISLRNLGYPSARASHAPDGRVWYQNAPSVATLRSIVAEPKLGQLHLDRVVELYDRILRLLVEFDNSLPSGDLRIEDAKEQLNILVSAAKQYYTEFFFLHDTYDYLLENVARQAAACSPKMKTAVVDKLLQSSQVVGHFVERREFPRVEKGAFSADPITSLPQLSLLEETFSSQKLGNAWLKENFLEEDFTSREHQEQFEDLFLYAVRFFVAKERRFLMNKCLYSRISWLLRCFFPSLQSLKRNRNVLDIPEIASFVAEVASNANGRG
ncbi:hypothetical protein [Litoreibacter janthinus]|uniref:Uncharacterized protein n=1 Tax=Litoreibacter janthinus TaxID=670154 RepID=A0A1I6HRW5_9RHOB|nr:hypothetical protein [Litoreibacter janthinus]SFR57163.1 hypothetical protein SAMN04488002_3321 [Litoreibacter janthinus]